MHNLDGVALAAHYSEYFDKILLDAPCSSETRFIKGDVRTFGFWSERHIKQVAYNQRKLLFAAWNALKPGGTLVYSTCTFAPEENEVQITRLLERDENAKLEEIVLPGLTRAPVCSEWEGKKLHKDMAKTLRMLPDSVMEGFFVARVGKGRLSNK